MDQRPFGRSRSRGAILAILTGWFVGCGSPVAWDDLSILGASEITVREGLPNPSHDEAAFVAARAGFRPQVERAGYPFYAEAFPATDPLDRPNLVGILGDEATYRKFSGAKKCGGFHPDYAVEWLNDTHRWTALICFTCQEVMMVGPDSTRRYDLAPRAAKRLATALDECRRHRPLILPPPEVSR